MFMTLAIRKDKKRKTQEHPKYFINGCCRYWRMSGRRSSSRLRRQVQEVRRSHKASSNRKQEYRPKRAAGVLYIFIRDFKTYNTHVICSRVFRSLIKVWERHTVSIYFCTNTVISHMLTVLLVICLSRLFYRRWIIICWGAKSAEFALIRFCSSAVRGKIKIAKSIEPPHLSDSYEESTSQDSTQVSSEFAPSLSDFKSSSAPTPDLSSGSVTPDVSQRGTMHHRNPHSLSIECIKYNWCTQIFIAFYEYSIVWSDANVQM